MSEEQLNKDLKNQFSLLSEEIGDSLKQIFNNDVSIEIDSEFDVKLSEFFEKDPKQVCIYFTTKNQGTEYGHLFILTPEFASQLYAWMIGDEPAESLGEEQLEGLKEATDQVIGRVKMVIAEDSLSIENIEILLTESISEINPFIEGKEGVTKAFNIKISDADFQVPYYLFSLKIRENVINEEEVSVQPAEFESIPQQSVKKESTRNIDMLMDVELEITVELGRKTSLISEVLKLGKGSILELEKSAGENLDIFVNGKKLAEGEVVVIDEHFGIRITQLISPKERVNLLK